MSALARLLAIFLTALGLGGAATEAARVPAGVSSIQIRSAIGITNVTRPADVRKIVKWFDALPRFIALPCPFLRAYPPDVSFTFRGTGSAPLLRAVDHAPGTCVSSVTYGAGGQGYPELGDDGFVARVSRLLGVDFDPKVTTARNKAAARLDAAMLVGLARVPAGSRRLAKPPDAALRTADSTPGTTALVDVHGLWKVRLPLESVLAFEKAHRPRGSAATGSGTGYDHSVITSQQLTFSFPARAGRISSRELEVDLVPLRDGWTGIRIDAQDVWIVARSPNEKVPAGVRAIVIHAPSRLARRITRPAQVARIVHWFDGLPVAQPGFRGIYCPITLGPLVTIDFIGAGTATLATASVLYNGGVSGPCNTIAFSVSGRNEAPLVGGSLLRRIERLRS